MAMGIFEGHMAKMADGFRAVRQAEARARRRLRPGQARRASSPTSTGASSATRSGSSARRWWRSAATARCTTSASRTCRARWPRASRSRCWWSTPRSTRTPAARPAPRASSARSPTWRSTARPRRASRSRARRSALIGMAHRTTYVMQGTIANASHMIEGFIRGLKARRPALFNLYTSCQPEHGIGDDMSSAPGQAGGRVARLPALPLRPGGRQDPGRVLRPRGQPGARPGLADLHAQVPRRQPRQGDGAAAHLRRLRDHRGALPQALPDRARPTPGTRTWCRSRSSSSCPRTSARGSSPTSGRSTASSSCRGCWSTRPSSSPARTGATSGRCCARSPASASRRSRASEIEAEVRRELAGKIGAGAGATSRRGGGGGGAPRRSPPAPGGGARRRRPRPRGDYLAPWLDTDQCTACDECTKLNPKIFAYNANKKAYIKDAATAAPTRIWSRPPRSARRG